MDNIGIGLVVIGGIVSLICWIMVLIELFKKQGIGLGILGVLCGLFTFVWGWVKSKELGLKKIMLIWTGAWIATSLGYAMAMPMLMKKQMDLQKEQQRLMQESMRNSLPE